MTVTTHYELDSDAYHACPDVSNSMLSRFKQSPYHLKHWLDNPTPPTPAMILGTTTHFAILEPELFEKTYARLPDLDMRTKKGKEAKHELEQLYGAGFLVKPDTYDTVLKMRDAVWSHPKAYSILDGAYKEVSRFWQHESGVECKARIDIMPDQDGQWGEYLADLKTSHDVSVDAFKKTLYNFGYYRGAAHYLDSFQASEFVEMDSEFSDTRNPDKRDKFLFVCVESSEPHAVAIYELDFDALELGREELDILLARYAECEENQEWPSYPTEVRPIGLPGWAYTRGEL